MSDLAIRVDRLSKLYRIGEAEQRHETLLGAALSFLRSPLENYRSLRRLSEFAVVVADHTKQKAESRIDFRFPLSTFSFSNGPGFHPELTGRETILSAGTRFQSTLDSPFLEP